MKKLVIIAIAAAIGLGANFGAQAAETPEAQATAAATPKAERAIPFHGVVSAVDEKAMTFTTTSKKGVAKVYKVTGTTEITKAGQPAKFSDIVVNDEIRGAYWKKADGSMETKSVKLGPLTPEEQAEKAARKAKKAEKEAAADKKDAAQ